MSTPWLDGLNPAQREAVMYGDGPLLVVAGAGTGKTRTLASRVAYLINRGVSPESILLLTFTRRAASEMLHRAGQMACGEATRQVWGGTFHAVSHRLLRTYAKAVSLPDDFTVLDQADAADLMNLIRTERGIAKRDRRFPRKATLVSIYSRMVNAQEPLSETLETHFPWCHGDADQVTEIFESYTQRKKEQHLLDFDDLLLFWSLLCSMPGVGDRVADRFDHILVDEYQDTNAIQAEILRGMRRNKKNIMVVGDDAQSIYSFRAASIRNILDFPEQFAGTRVVKLEQNYRSTRPILDASNAVMDEASERYTKTLWSERERGEKPTIVTCLDEPQQSEEVCRCILAHFEMGKALMDQAVLFRAGHHGAHLEVELSRRNIPFRKYGGLKFIETAHIKDMLAVLRILENPYDEVSWFRVLLLLGGIGPKTARRVMDGLGVRVSGGNESAPEVQSPLIRLAAAAPAVPPAAREAFDELRHTLIDCSGIASGEAGGAATGGDGGPKELPLVTQIERIRVFYGPVFERVYENATVRLADLDQLAQIAAGYRSRRRFITELTLDPPEAASDLAQSPFLEEDYLTLSTIHSAKGCEWTVVHVIHAADGMIPSDMAVRNEDEIEEERRLFYVAMTRAKDFLHVYFPMRYYHRRFGLGDAHNYAQITRFLSDSVRSLFQKRSAMLQEEVEKRDGEVGTKDPYERVSRLWKT